MDRGAGRRFILHCLILHSIRHEVACLRFALPFLRFSRCHARVADIPLVILCCGVRQLYLALLMSAQRCAVSEALSGNAPVLGRGGSGQLLDDSTTSSLLDSVPEPML